jgi:hypothetical protein
LGKGAGAGDPKAGLLTASMKSGMNKTNLPESRSFMETSLVFWGFFQPGFDPRVTFIPSTG